MMLPKQFDENEIFILVSLCVVYYLLFRLRKKLPFSIILLIMLFASTVGRLSDHLLSGPTIDLYDISDSGKYDLFDLLTYVLYGPFAYFLVLLFIKKELKGYRVVLFFLLTAFGGVLYEGLSAMFELFTYKGWKLSYSFSYYLFVQPLTILFYLFIQSQHEKLQYSSQ